MFGIDQRFGRSPQCGEAVSEWQSDDENQEWILRKKETARSSNAGHWESYVASSSVKTVTNRTEH